MSALLQRLLGICALRQGPQDLPYAPGVAGLLVIVVVVLEALLAPVLEVPEAQVLPRAALSALMLIGAPWLLLQLRGRGARFVQTLIAMAGTGLLFTLAAVPLLVGIVGVSVTSQPPSPSVQILIVLLLLMVLWKLMVDAHIWRQALDWPQAGGILIALGLFLIEMGLDRWLQQTYAT